MDTDDLSRETYQAVLLEAEELTHDLTLHFGLLSGECENESEFLEKAQELAVSLMEADEDELVDLFFGDPPAKAKLISTCKKILQNIEKVKSIPIEKRKFDF